MQKSARRETASVSRSVGRRESLMLSKMRAMSRSRCALGSAHFARDGVGPFLLNGSVRTAALAWIYTRPACFCSLRDLQATQWRVMGSAFRRSKGIGQPHSSHWP